MTFNFSGGRSISGKSGADRAAALAKAKRDKKTKRRHKRENDDESGDVFEGFSFSAPKSVIERASEKPVDFSNSAQEQRTADVSPEQNGDTVGGSYVYNDIFA